MRVEIKNRAAEKLNQKIDKFIHHVNFVLMLARIESCHS